MPEKLSLDLGNVQKTLFLPLWGRAVESQKPHPLLLDRAAIEIMNKIDYDFSSIAGNTHAISQRTWVCRSVIVDRVLEEFLLVHPRGTVVNVGCGLDTTFDRVDQGTLRWYDVDFPDVIALRRTLIEEHERRRFMACSFLDTSWFQQIRVDDQVLFVAAGVFYYSEKADIRGFLHTLADVFPGSELVCDVCSEQGAKIANKEVIARSGLDERSFLKWGLRNTQELLSWDSRMHLLNEYQYFRKRKRGLTLRDKILAFASDLLRIQWVIHVRFGDAA